VALSPSWASAQPDGLETFVRAQRSARHIPGRSYLAGFDAIGLRCTFTTAPDGKIAGVGLRLE
jgi:hypothetical protein